MRERQIVIDGERVIVVLDSLAPETRLMAAPIGRGVHITIELPSSIHDGNALEKFLHSMFTTEGLQERIAEDGMPKSI